jgi:hypothetical protein
MTDMPFPLMILVVNSYIYDIDNVLGFNFVLNTLNAVFHHPLRSDYIQMKKTEAQRG